MDYDGGTVLGDMEREIRRVRSGHAIIFPTLPAVKPLASFFISLCCCAPHIKEEKDRELEDIKRKWGRTKTEAREDRKTRKALWGRDV